MRGRAEAIRRARKLALKVAEARARLAGQGGHEGLHQGAGASASNMRAAPVAASPEAMAIQTELEGAYLALGELLHALEWTGMLLEAPQVKAPGEAAMMAARAHDDERCEDPGCTETRGERGFQAASYAGDARCSGQGSWHKE
ncbi:G protein-coupled receptor family protein [Pyxidicoccus xibeiensis]|uniref:hypothetical protein n=1 Tax=Pyxidicoccus xibeiensis TaxID=2906759 RepID=UPI0020A76C63|nr:hypothetical protein [Pyxidicoccus xibeiensis]MCP3139392.1 hypothetical protein [Pyxidicoccus xibeiensis]